MTFPQTAQEARDLDRQDPLARLRSRFLFPQHDAHDCIYFCGNSLGLLPRDAEARVHQEFADWQAHGVEGHFNAMHPWYSYHAQFREPLAALTGALPTEVTCMNSLTVNVHLMMTTFYRPQGRRTKIVLLGNEFPSDRYAAESHVRLHGLHPDEHIVEISPREGEHELRTEDIVAAIDAIGDELSVLHFSAVHYYTGQFFDVEKITKAVHGHGGIAGWDLAHAIGNVPLRLHEWNVDYAAWCSYKYLNSGPGGVGGCFVHERHCRDTELVRPAGWWGNDEKTRFTMPHRFVPVESADSWQLSNAPVFSMAIHKAALDVFSEAGMDAVRAKSLHLSSYLMHVIDTIGAEFPDDALRIVTPRHETMRGAQVSTIATRDGRKMFDALMACGVVADWRNPDVIRMAPAPLYCSFEDVHRFGEILHSYCRTR
ncbi:MAG: kynureninase [Candidatus Kapaibacterium sp.]